MAGAGKSTVGRELANILNFRLIDSDVLIEEKILKHVILNFTHSNITLINEDLM